MFPSFFDDTAFHSMMCLVDLFGLRRRNNALSNTQSPSPSPSPSLIVLSSFESETHIVSSAKVRVTHIIHSPPSSTPCEITIAHSSSSSSSSSHCWDHSSVDRVDQTSHLEWPSWENLKNSPKQKVKRKKSCHHYFQSRPSRHPKHSTRKIWR